MKKTLKKAILSILALSLFLAVLSFPKQALAYAGDGLLLWFQNMIPALFPFMVLTGLMIRLHLTENFACVLSPVLGRLFFLSPNCLYVIFTGFLCGFPMGAKVTADMYHLGKLTRAEAELLLSFCNNIGPVYFTGFVLLALQKAPSAAVCLFGMYGLPFFFGLFLRHTFYRKKIPYKTAFSKKSPESIQKPPAFLVCLDASISSGIDSITKLGGYMIFFNLLNLLPFLLFSHFSLNPVWFSSIRLLFEITGGILSVKGSFSFLILVLLHFGGLSCIAQTYSMIADTNLSLSKYVFSKLVQSLLAACYYLIWFSF